MLRKSLLLSAALCVLAAPMAMAADYSTLRQAASAGSQSYGVCLRNSGEAISWVKNELQCRNSTNASQWVENGIVTHIYTRGN